jgi:hypothetical protein
MSAKVGRMPQGAFAADVFDEIVMIESKGGAPSCDTAWRFEA